MPLVHLVVGLALLEFCFFGWAVSRARVRFGVAAPATTGHEVFERTFRVQMNTLEQLVVFLPSIVLFARYVNAYAAAALGAVFVIGRALYFRGYVHAAQGRHLGFMLSAIPNVSLLVGAIIGVLVALGARG
jgi:glutathione S-transferase